MLTPTMTPQGDTPGPRLKAARLSAGLTQAQLAKRMGLTQGRIHQAEADLYGTSLDWLARAAKAIGCSPSDLSPQLAGR